MATVPAAHPVPCATTVRRLHSHRDRLVTTLMKRVDQDYAWYRDLSAKDRSWVGLVAQHSISAFIAWCEDKHATAASPQEIFAVAPAELARTISLQQTLQLVRTGVDVIETEAEVVSAPGRASELHDAILRYSREFAFTTAEVYARAAEARGSWDARLEALVVDAVVRGDVGQSLKSRAAALGWRGEGSSVAVVVGLAAPLGEQKAAELRHVLRRAAPDSLVGFLADRILVLLGGLDNFKEAVAALVPKVGDGAVVVGPTVAGLEQVPRSLAAANAGLDAVAAWPDAPRPVLADELLPERLLVGDAGAAATLRASIYDPLVAAGKDVLATLATYLELGRSLEGSARALYVHPNTVRYRLGKITDVCGWDPTDPREAYVLQHALACGRLAAAGSK
ncbi:MAG: helix-turn-helix domain-containing protein [Bifidobacteriaceae bacterium]|jgi:DNA-binding PucR family transcriptional regulator|nr:helix-turn-helix domain-containing protein [Bifidobacteriaceae bacterium]